MEQAGIDPAASCMLSKRSTIWATIPDKILMIPKNISDNLILFKLFIYCKIYFLKVNRKLKFEN